MENKNIICEYELNGFKINLRKIFGLTESQKNLTMAFDKLVGIYRDGANSSDPKVKLKKLDKVITKIDTMDALKSMRPFFMKCTLKFMRTE
jgi:hypothetical protein